MELSAFPFLLEAVVPYAALGGAGYLAFRFVRAYERRCLPSEDLGILAERVKILEYEIAEIEARVDRSDEIQRFTTRVLAGRASAGAQ